MDFLALSIEGGGHLLRNNLSKFLKAGVYFKNWYLGYSKDPVYDMSYVNYAHVWSAGYSFYLGD